MSTVPEEVSDETGSVPEPHQSRWKRYETTLRTKAARARETAEARRDDSRIYDAGFRVYERNRLLPASVLVGALASRIVIYLIPLLALVIVTLGLYADTGAEGADQAARSIADVFADAVTDSRDVSQGFRFAALVATIFAVLYAANSLGRLIRRVTALVWGVPYQRSAKQWVPAAAVLSISVLGLFITGTGSWSTTWSWQLTVGVAVVEFSGLMLLWLLVSRRLPHDPEASKWSDFLPGAVFLGIGVVGLRLAMVVYFVPQSADLAERYGSIGVALVMLTWAYWLGMIIVGGSELNAAMLRSRQEGSTQERG